MPRLGPSPGLQCRYRKVRCDRRQDTCGSCERLQFACSFKEPSGQKKDQRNRQAAPPERRRAIRACLACKHLKARCSGELPECDNCRRRQQRCRYASSDLSETVESLKPLNEPGIDGWLGPLFPIRRQEMLDAIDRFFRHLFPILSFCFLHEPSIREHCMSGTLDPSLALVLAAVTNVYLSSEKSLLQECKSWMRRVETEIWEHLHQPSIIRVQTLLLIVHYHIQTGEFSRAYMLAGMAARSATALRLNYERPGLGFIAQETRRRVLWALTSVDGIFSVGLPEYETMPYAIVYQQLPCSEEEYSGRNEPQTHPNLLAACFQVSKIQRDVMRLTRQLAISDKPLVELPGLVQEIQNELWRLHSDLELTADFSISATSQPLKMKGSRWFARYLMASLSWHQVHCDLYRIFLPGYAEAVPTAIMDATDVNFRYHAAEMCRIHVQLIFKILTGVLKADVPLLPLYVAVCTYQAARLALFLPSLGSEITTESAISSATSALGVLYKFFSAAPWAQDIIADLERLVQGAPGVGHSHSVYSGPVHDSARHRHSQLAVHSLIRQANFVDGGYEDYPDHL